MAISDLIDYCNHRWRLEHGFAEDLLIASKRGVSARLGGIEFSSRFDSVRLAEAPSLTVGHIARLCSKLPGGEHPVPQETEAGDPAQIVRFDRLCRTLHLLNYLNWRQDDSNILFLEVQARHILSIPRGHGTYFAGVIHRCGLTPSQVVLTASSVFTACQGEYLRRLADGMANYRNRGYRLAIELSELPLSKSLGNLLYYIAPDYVALNAGHLDTTRKAMPAFLGNQLDRLQRLADGFGGKVLLQGVTDQDTLDLAKAHRIALVEGSHFDKRRKRAPHSHTRSHIEMDAHV